MIESCRDLKVWQAAMELAEDSYRLTRGFPKEEMFGMVSQIRRAAVSIAANIAEGHGRENTGSFIQFLRISQGSLKELETHLILSTRVKFTHMDVIEMSLQRCESLGKMLRSLIRSLQQRNETK